MAVEADIGEPPQADEPGRRRSILIAVVLIGGTIEGIAARPCNGFPNAAHLAGGIAGGIVVFLILWAVVAGIVKLARAAKHNPSSWRSAGFARATIATMIVFAVFGTLGRANERSKECEKPSHVSAAALSPAQSQYVAWLKAWLPCLDYNGMSLTAYETKLLAAVKGTSGRAAQSAASTALAAYRASAACVAKLPAGSPTLAAMNRKLLEGTDLMVKGHEDYQRGISELLRGRKATALEGGDGYVQQARALDKSAAAEGEALYRSLGGAAALGSHLPAAEYEALFKSQ